MNPERRTYSELLFEEYLRRNEHGDFDFEPELPGQSKRPDYRVFHDTGECLFEVKELEPRERKSRVACYDGYKSLRRLIDKARDKFKSLKEWPCSLVVCNLGDWTARLDPPHVFGAMLGNLGFSMPFDPIKGQVDPDVLTSTFLKGGRMLFPHGQGYRNRTISAVIVIGVEQYDEPNFARDRDRKLLDAHWKKGRPLTHYESLDVVWEFSEKYPRGCFSEPRVVVVENPVARLPLSRDLLIGPYDERWAIHDGKTTCIYEGDLLKEQRRLKEEAQLVAEKVHS